MQRKPFFPLFLPSFLPLCTMEVNKKHVGEADLTFMGADFRDDGVVFESHNDMPKPKDAVEPESPTQKYGTV